MDNFTVVSACFYPDTKPAWRLIKSCEQRGIPLHLYGVGETFQSWWDAKVVRLIEELKRLPHEYVMYTDAADTWCVSTLFPHWCPREDGVLVSGERSCFPPGMVLSNRLPTRCYPEPRCPYEREWKGNLPFPCAGQFTGKRDAVISALESLRRIPEHETNDQASWIHGMVNGYVDAKVDVWGWYFHTMDGPRKDFAIEPRYGGKGFELWVKYGNTKTMVQWLHFNGGNKEERMEEYRELWPSN